MIGAAKVLRPVRELAAAVAATETTVLILGESGTGKELVAEGIHDMSPRSAGPLVRMNCAALPETLLETELFGHEAGAFTGAIGRRKGRFEQADGGTLFLDEIGDIPPATQVRLLRVLQDGRFRRVGGSEELEVDVRIVAATHRDLQEEMAAGRFRQDLYYRLAVFPIHMPPLRDRRSDIMMLADTFVERSADTPLRFTSRAIDALVAYHWPGNVRELENCVARAVLLAENGVIHAHHLPPSIRLEEQTPKGTLESVLSAVERDLVDDALKTARGNMASAARALGISERQMGLRVHKHGLDRQRYRRSAGDDKE